MLSAKIHHKVTGVFLSSFLKKGLKNSALLTEWKSVLVSLKKREDDSRFPGKKKNKSNVSPSSSVSLCFLSVAPCSCPYLPLGKSSVCAGEEVFIITCCLGSWIEFLHLCPHSLSRGLLSDTLYLLSFTSLMLSTGNTSTYLSPSLPPLLPPPPLHHR